MFDSKTSNSQVNHMVLGISFYQCIEIFGIMWDKRSKWKYPTYTLIALSEFFLIHYMITNAIEAGSVGNQSITIADGNLSEHSRDKLHVVHC